MATGETPAVPPEAQPEDAAAIREVDIQRIETWQEPPEVTFHRQASYDIAKWILAIFAAVYALCFIAAFALLRFSDAKFDGGLELIKFMIGSILPLATLAVGYYLGDKIRTNSSR